MASVSPTQSDIQKVLRAFLLDVLPSGTVDVIQGKDNKVPEPALPNYVVMTPTRRSRLSTNGDSFVDSLFTGSIAGTVMTIATVVRGAIKIGSVVFGVGVSAGTKVTAFLTGAGGVGTYTVTPSQTVALKTLAAGSRDMLQPTNVNIQLDVHGPLAADNAQIIATALCDEYATQKFAEHPGGYDVTPLYAEDPREMPFVNGEQQYESRFVIEVGLQANQVVSVPQQFASAVDVGLISVDAEYPP